MKKRKRIQLKINLTNRWLYTLIVIGILVIVGVGVYALAPNPGHTTSEIDFSGGISGNLKVNGEITSSTRWSSQTYGGGWYMTDGTWIRSYGSKNVYVNTLLRADGGLASGDVAPGAGNIQAAGSVTAASFYYSSDKSLKTNIQPLQNSLKNLQKLQGVSFDWKDNGEKSIGLIAQDVEKIYPELVSTDAEGIKTVDYGKLVAVLIEAIKEQQAQINELKELNN